MFNRTMEGVWQAGEAFDLVKQGPSKWPAALGVATAAAITLFVNSIWPGIVEQLASPIKADPDESWWLWGAKGLAHSLGSQYVGARDFINATLAGSSEASMGLMGALFKAGLDVNRDIFQKKNPFAENHLGALIQHGTTLVGMLTGMSPTQIGKAGRFAYDVAYYQESEPEGPWGWLTGLRYGTLKDHSRTWEEWKRNHLWRELGAILP
jgi:hypothetical protein